MFKVTQLAVTKKEFEPRRTYSRAGALNFQGRPTLWDTEIHGMSPHGKSTSAPTF